jgi:hypothetical protein
LDFSEKEDGSRFAARLDFRSQDGRMICSLRIAQHFRCGEAAGKIRLLVGYAYNRRSGKFPSWMT